MEAILVDCVNHSLRDFMYRNAIFICERLCSQFQSETNLQLLASCYLRNNQAYCAYHILKGTKMAQSRYLFAISCFQMDFLKEAEAALSPLNEPSAEVPNGAAGHYLLGLIYRYTDRSTYAIHHFKETLTLDPLMWAAYEELCVLGAADLASTVFGEAASRCVQNRYLHQDLASHSLYVPNEGCNLDAAKNISFEESSPRQLKHAQGNNFRDISGNSNQSLNSSSSNSLFYNTPSPVTAQFSSVAPPPLCRNIPQNGSQPNTTASESSPKSTINAIVQAPRRKVVDEGKIRKISSRLLFNNDSGIRRSTRLSGDTGVNAGAPSTMVAGNGTTTTSSKYLPCFKPSSLSLRSLTSRKGHACANENINEAISLDDAQMSVTSSISGQSLSGETRLQEIEDTAMHDGHSMNSSKIISGTSEILSLLRTLGEGYRLSCLYRCRDALDVYLKLPAKHYNTGWVLSQVGKAYFELVDYLKAARAFSLARDLSPYSSEGMDIYSTVLYHLKEDMKLSYLARELVSTDRLAPQSWCAMGNYYSMQKDHETALKNFQRAVKVNPRFAYAHTLCGHEYASLEDFEDGIRSYQSALNVDSRHYNSWYGLGMIYLRQEKFDFSEHHFRRAFHINPHSSVIMSYLGTALHTLKRNQEALMMMDNAIAADPKNPLPMYQKASILMNLESFDEALEVLKVLIECAPRESSVYALMGAIYKRNNMPDKAMLHYGLALDMKPSAIDVAYIKASIEKLLVPDDLED